MNIRLPRPSPALVIACIALFVSLGGVSYGFATGSIDGREIKNSTITTKDIRNNQVRGIDIGNSSVTGRDVALDTLGGLDIKESKLGKVPSAQSADVATRAGSATSAEQIAGVPPSEFVRREAPSYTPLGSGTVAYDVDAAGYVHLQGSTTATGALFTLPAGTRPSATSRFVVADGDDTDEAVLTIAPTGQATLTGASGTTSLDGVTFAAG